MGSLHEKVINALKIHFTDILDGLETIKSTGRVTGWVAAKAFDGLDDRDRQVLLWGVLEAALEPEELNDLGPIVTLSPVEAEIDVSGDG
jgi:hypothetical protein